MCGAMVRGIRRTYVFLKSVSIWITSSCIYLPSSCLVCASFLLRLALGLLGVRAAEIGLRSSGESENWERDEDCEDVVGLAIVGAAIEGA